MSNRLGSTNLIVVFIYQKLIYCRIVSILCGGSYIISYRYQGLLRVRLNPLSYNKCKRKFYVDNNLSTLIASVRMLALGLFKRIFPLSLTQSFGTVFPQNLGSNFKM